MSTPASGLPQDQNLNILNNGITPGGKVAYAAKSYKKGGALAGRRALNDISNSRKPSVHRTIKKDNSINVFSTEKDTTAVNPKLTLAPEKGRVGGRKALTDLTNSVQPTSEPALNLSRKANGNIPSSVTDEGFLHNHQECVAAQTNAVDMDYFLKSVGLYHDIPVIRAPPLTPKKPESNTKQLEMEDMPKPEVLGYFSPLCHRSCMSPKAPYMSWEYDGFSDLKIIDSPKFT